MDLKSLKPIATEDLEVGRLYLMYGPMMKEDLLCFKVLECSEYEGPMVKYYYEDGNTKTRIGRWDSNASHTKPVFMLPKWVKPPSIEEES
jgi:hypothetical protein